MSDTARSIYITSPEGETGKSTIALGVLDLLVRKVAKDDGAEMLALLGEVMRLDDTRLRAAAERLETATQSVLDAQRRDPDVAQSVAVAYLDAAGWLLGGWMLARAAAEDAGTYGNVAEFYMRRLLPRSAARIMEIDGALAA